MKIIVLGTAAAISTKERDNTSLCVLPNNDIPILIDCSGSIVHRLEKAKIEWHKIEEIIITHGHIDHIYGIPSLIHHLWLRSMGKRNKPLRFYGPTSALERIKKSLSVYGLTEKPKMFPWEFHKISTLENDLVFSKKWGEVRSTPVLHGQEDTIAISFFENKSSKRFVYSSDTEPCVSLEEFASMAELLIHECAYLDEIERKGHSNIYQAVNIANKAKVKELVLIHFDWESLGRIDTAMNQVQPNFYGKVSIANDFDVFEVV
jgi:ribonuclease Z